MYVDLYRHTTPLMEASYRGHFWCVEATLKLFKERHSGTAELIKFVNQEEPHQKQTALIMAANQGHAPIVLELLNAGAMIESMDDEGYTPLIHACKMAHIGVVEVLLAKGARVNDRILRFTNDNDMIDLVTKAL